MFLAKGYAAERRAGITDEATPSSTQAGGFVQGSSAGDAGDPVDWLARYGSTTHFDVIDSEGNALGCTHSLGGGYGCGLVVPGAGFALNNFHNWADLDPASPASIAPGRLASETDISCSESTGHHRISLLFRWCHHHPDIFGRSSQCLRS